MAFSNQNNQDSIFADMLGKSSASPIARVDANAVIRTVYVWMGLGLAVTMIVAYIVGQTPALLELAIQPGMNIITFIALIATVIALSAGMNRNWLSPGLAAGLFMLFAAIMGFSLSVIMVSFLSETIVLPNGTVQNTLYNPQPVYAAAASAATLFGVMTFVGFTTKADLTKMGTYLFIGLIGIIIASVINIFMQSDTMSFVISIIGVIIFTGLTAYDTQKIKEMSMNPALTSDGNLIFKLSIIGALTLYLDLINLFLFLLRLFSSDR